MYCVVRSGVMYIIAGHPHTVTCFWLLPGDQNLTGDREIDDREFELQQVLEGERFTPLFKVGICLRHRESL